MVCESLLFSSFSLLSPSFAYRPQYLPHHLRLYIRPQLRLFSPSRLLAFFPPTLLPSCPPALLPFYPSRPQVSRLENRATQRTISQPHFHSQNLWGGWSWERAWRKKIIRYKFTSQHRHRYRHLSHLSSLPIEEESQGQKLIRLIRKRKS